MSVFDKHMIETHEREKQMVMGGRYTALQFLFPLYWSFDSHPLLFKLILYIGKITA